MDFFYAGENLVRVRDLLERLLGAGVLVHVGVVPARELAAAARFTSFESAGAGDAEHVVIIATRANPQSSRARGRRGASRARRRTHGRAVGQNCGEEGRCRVRVLSDERAGRATRGEASRRAGRKRRSCG